MLLAPPLTGAPLVLPAGEEFGGPLVRPVLARGGSPRAAVVLVTLANRAASAASLAAPAVLVGVRALGSNVAVTRAQTPTGAVALQETATAGVWEQIGADLPRYAAASGRLLVRAADTNLVRNPRGESATNFVVANAGGLTATFIGTGTSADGLPFFTYEIAGTPSSTAGSTISFESSTQITAAANEAITVSAFIGLDPDFANTITGLAFSLRAVAYTPGLSDSSGASFTPATSALAGQRVTTTRTMPASTTSMQPRIRYNGAVGVAVSCRIRVGALMTRRGSAAADPVLPVVGTPASATRAIDVPIWTPSAMPARGAILLRGSLDALAGASALGLLHLDDGTDSNRITARIGAGGGQPECLVVSGGVTTATLTPTGALTAGADFRALLAWSPGAVRFGTSAGGIVSASVARPAGLTRGLIGHANAAGTLPLGGEPEADLYDYWPSEAEALAILAG